MESALPLIRDERDDFHTQSEEEILETGSTSHISSPEEPPDVVIPGSPPEEPTEDVIPGSPPEEATDDVAPTTSK